GETLLVRALRNACSGEVAQVVVVAPRSHVAEAEALVSVGACRAPVTVVGGGPARTDSVAAGLAALADDIEVVLVHDAARALAPPSLFAAVILAVRGGHGAVVPGMPVSDTVKQVGPGGEVVATLERSALRAVQTPQGFTREVLARAHAGSGTATDDAGLVERLGLPVHVVDGDPLAFKITTPLDLAVAECLVRVTPS
ncbi:MAG: IspD/TarI family cytidylyltransferase, partial [Lapillicoccus sp.]